MRNEVKDATMRAVYDVSDLSHFNYHDEAPLWWGFWGIILIESTVFASLIASYFYLGLSYPELPPAGIKKPELLIPTLSAVLLFASSYPMHIADQASKRGAGKRVRNNLLISIALATLFLVLKYIEYSDVPYRWDSHAYGSVVWAIVMFHSVHVSALVLKTIVITYLANRGYFTDKRHLGVTVNGIYWHFVVVVWLPLYLVLYISPWLF